jgi:hypothetical protein
MLGHLFFFLSTASVGVYLWYNQCSHTHNLFMPLLLILYDMFRPLVGHLHVMSFNPEYSQLIDTDVFFLMYTITYMLTF